MRENDFRQELLRAARRLAFNRGSDAALLAFRDGGDAAGLEGLDLSAVGSIHRAANGAVDVKFIDRIKLIELLLGASDDRPRGEAGDGFIQALDRAAMRLGGDEGAAKAADEYAAGELDLARERRAADVGGAVSAGDGYGGAARGAGDAGG